MQRATKFRGALIPSVILLTLPVFSVTGLGVVDTGQHFTLAGEILLMFLMQIGPLTLAYMLARPEPSLLKYPEDTVLTG